jgi:predicted cobalt transporter CbtA
VKNIVLPPKQEWAVIDADPGSQGGGLLQHSGLGRGIFGIIPTVAVFGILGLYSVYLLHLGLPDLMKAPQEKAIGYTVVVIIVAIVLWIVIGAIVAQFAWRPAMGVPGL